MPDRLSVMDASFLYMEDDRAPMHVGGLTLYAAPERGGFDFEGMVRLIGSRIGQFRRYRQKVRFVPGNLGRPVWVDDPDFDLSYHVRRSALPKPGTDAQLRELAARLFGRRLDRDRPLWEVYLIEGLKGGGFAIVTKTHHAMVDGISAVDAGALLLDIDAHATAPPPAGADDDPQWHPDPEPGPVTLTADAVLDLVRHPWSVLDTAQLNAMGGRAIAETTLRTVGGVWSALWHTGEGAPASPLNASVGQHRRYATAATALDDYKAIRKAHGGKVNDVVLAAVAGGLRRWLLTRGEPVPATTTVRAMVPVSTRDSASRTGGNQVSAYLVDLPVGETDPVARLTRITATMQRHKGSDQALGATALISLVGLAPPAVHSLGARLASNMSSRIFNVVVTNVPGPQFPLYALGCQALDMFPMVPLSRGQAVSIGITSYNGGVFYGLNADRDSMADVDVLADSIAEGLAELAAAAA